jgi:hypothetical protein
MKSHENTPLNLRRACLAGALALLSALPARAAELSWFRLPPGCPHLIEEGLAEMPCGSYGRLFFGLERLVRPNCAGVTSGHEVPSLYLTPAPEALPSGWSPCAGGSCFEARGRGPWVAVVDWNAPHGWSVGETILQSSDYRVNVELFDLASPGNTLPPRLNDVGDAHVLAQLCAVAERTVSSEPPVAVNMSFGRVPGPAGTPSCQPTAPWALECEIRGVLAHLASERGVLPIAAAGNHAQLLFPASDPNVVAAGALDLARFASEDEAEASNETPSGAQALVLGYALYLENPAHAGEFWQGPAGSSYASAFLSGWIAGTREQTENEASAASVTSVVTSIATSTITSTITSIVTSAVPTPRWAPRLHGGTYWLEHNGQIVDGSDLLNPNLLLERAFGQHPEACVHSAMGTLPVLRKLSLPPPALPQLSLAGLAATRSQQLPGVVLCVPCHGDGPPGGFELEVDLVVNLAGSPPLPQSYRLTGLYLKIGHTLHQLNASRDPKILGDLERGTLKSLGLAGIATLLQPGQQLSLVYTLTTEDGTPFWHATPVHVHDH